MSGGKGKSHGGKAGPKGAADGSRQQVSHSAKAGLQVRNFLRFHMVVALGVFWGTKRPVGMGKARAKIQQMMKERFLFLNAFEFLLSYHFFMQLNGLLVAKVRQQHHVRINKTKRAIMKY